MSSYQVQQNISKQSVSRGFLRVIFSSADPTLGFDEISFCENFAKLATKRSSCFAKMRNEFREFRSFAKLRDYESDEFRETRKSRKRRQLEVKIQNLTIFLLIFV
jgi:hypothetical protein